MKLRNRDYAPNSSGTITFTPEGPDDLWILYNLIKQGDHLSAETSRKLHQSTNGAPKPPTRVRIKISIKVLTTEFDNRAALLRARGKTVSSDTPGAAASAAFHTIELRPDLPFDLTKKAWDSHALGLLNQCSDPSNAGSETADLAVVLIRDATASLHLIGKSRSKLCAKIEKKKNDPTMFFSSVFNSFIEFVNLETTRFAIIASPGSVKDQFFEFLMAESQRRRVKSITNNKSRIALIGTNSRQGLKDVVEMAEVKRLVSGSIDAEESEVYRAFSDALGSDSGRACYGARSVEMAAEMFAVETLLISDELYRSCDVGERRKYGDLVEAVRKSGGAVRVFRSETMSGAELGKMTGVAAILRFPVPDLDELEL